MWVLQVKHSGVSKPSLVPRTCAFVACSAKFAQNFVLQATNAQGLGMWLYEVWVWVDLYVVQKWCTLLSCSCVSALHACQNALHLPEKGRPIIIIEGLLLHKWLQVTKSCMGCDLGTCKATQTFLTIRYVCIFLAHREHDKGPDEFCSILMKLMDAGLEFCVSILGAHTNDIPGR